jgi:hypothetical protein
LGFAAALPVWLPQSVLIVAKSTKHSETPQAFFDMLRPRAVIAEKGPVLKSAA